MVRVSASDILNAILQGGEEESFQYSIGDFVRNSPTKSISSNSEHINIEHSSPEWIGRCNFIAGWRMSMNEMKKEIRHF